MFADDILLMFDTVLGLQNQLDSFREAASKIGKIIAEKAKQKGIKKVIFDRGRYLYHGRIKAFADSARKTGLDF